MHVVHSQRSTLHHQAISTMLRAFIHWGGAGTSTRTPCATDAWGCCSWSRVQRYLKHKNPCMRQHAQPPGAQTTKKNRKQATLREPKKQYRQSQQSPSQQSPSQQQTLPTITLPTINPHAPCPKEKLGTLGRPPHGRRDMVAARRQLPLATGGQQCIRRLLYRVQLRIRKHAGVGCYPKGQQPTATGVLHSTMHGCAGCWLPSIVRRASICRGV